MSSSEINSKYRKPRRKCSVIPFLKKVKKPNGISQESFEEIIQSFHMIDANKDGRLSKKELREAAFVIGMNPTDKEVETWWAKADSNGDGFISMEEYVEIMKSNYTSIDLERERMLAAFNVIDKNGDGLISLQEFIAVLTFNNSSISKEEATSVFNEIDRTGKGFVNYEEFVNSQICSVVFQ